jgi:UDP-N-acetylglucosamine:LPS N-acetylglucosamine transferase
VFGWVDNMQEWMAAADLMLSRAGGTTVAEALNAGLPILGFDPPPGDERRVCDLIEKSWQVGYWVKRPEDISVRIAHLLANPSELERLRANALARARPRAVLDAAEAILKLAESVD